MKTIIVNIFVVSAIFAVCESASAACGPNETVPQCEPCAVTCADRDNPCPAICIFNSQCYCTIGYLKKDGVCVPTSEC
ncbi:unnamed protein product [Callosobruchus maculatus]|uniref:TIL domain-containing protein n=1 Tax=Callosobruchus maculatus TaxID=64391 RepID=A0A653DD64_CALMS|nr:unnamed protein product [Callosobruchus maculatus]